MGSELTPAAFGKELSLSDELREQLGLGSGEVTRVLHSSASSLVLERACSDLPVALPWDRDLVLTADVRAFPLADILSMIHRSGKSGFVYFRRESHEKSVNLHRGEVVFASSNQKPDRIGECMLRSGAITLRQLQDAESSFSASDRFGKVLVQKGLLTPRGLWDGVKAQVEDIVRSLFAYTAGTVHFWEGEVTPDNVVRLSLPTRRLIAEGLQRRDELFKLLALAQDPRAKLVLGEPQSRDLAANERAFLQALTNENEFSAVCRRVGLDPLSGARTLQLLCLIGAVRMDRTEEPAAVLDRAETSRNEDDRVRECVTDHVKLLAELVSPIVAVDGQSDVAQRIGAVVQETGERYPELLRGVTVRAGGVLDPDELAKRALRLRGERIRIVGAALGELVTYLEFELRNHPRIQDPEHYLEAVDGLRAKLEL